VVNKGTVTSLHSQSGLELMFYFVGLFLGLQPMYLFDV